MLYTIILFSSCNANRKLFSPNSIIYLIDYGKILCKMFRRTYVHVCTRFSGNKITISLKTYTYVFCLSVFFFRTFEKSRGFLSKRIR